MTRLAVCLCVYGLLVGSQYLAKKRLSTVDQESNVDLLRN